MGGRDRGQSKGTYLRKAIGSAESDCHLATHTFDNLTPGCFQGFLWFPGVRLSKLPEQGDNLTRPVDGACRMVHMEKASAAIARS